MKVLQLTVNGQPLRFREEGATGGLIYNPGNGCSALITSHGLLILCSYIEGSLDLSRRAEIVSILAALELPIPADLRA
jgi:hypothetical protein